MTARRFVAVSEWVCLAVCVAVILIALFGQSRIFIRPQSWDVTPDGQVLVRQTPWGAVKADWVMEIVAPEGHECPAATGTATIQPAINDTVRLGLPDVVQPCAVPGAVATVSYTVSILGAPMWPVTITDIVE